MPARTASNWADPQPQPCIPTRSANYVALASANPKSPAASTSDALPCVASYHRRRVDRTTKKIATPHDIYRIKVTPLGTKPLICRRLLVPAVLTLAQLHDV